ncbi:allene oxide synthase-lipoxygenase protein-like [Neocloeon triangulifer]|uniref:allene oxide synthase-lipoxygenase protein-like n=1 Tax=Neocloeon triangulifer TaxID=2078957 RepID=UPI00286EC19A|nr:allene oxide synthase-lipoxygenase protein-like [Neocloeon triangulifer]
MLGALNSWLGSWWSVSRFKAHVTTGDRLYAGTDSTVYLQMVDSSGAESEPTCLDKMLVNDHERGETHSYGLKTEGLQTPEKLDHIVVWRHASLTGDDRWFLDRVEIEDRILRIRYIFPVQRWIEVERRYYLFEFDAFLPQDDRQIDNRRLELQRKREMYQFKQTIERGPKQIKDLPDDEKFSERYMLDFLKLKGKLIARTYHLKFTTEEWSSLEDVKNIYHPDSTLHRPECTKYWTEDRWFGLQRVQGVNSVLIELCKNIPKKFALQTECVEPFLEGFTLDEALEKNKIFIIDLELLNRAPCKNEMPVLVAPIGLFYLNKKDDLMPIAIQLFQDPSPTNPIYYPSDPPLTWIMAKMFFNMGDAQQHQSCTHLGLTHLLMETMCVAAHRNLSPSHPIFRLLAPHYLYLLAINARGLEKLISPGGWVDSGMIVGRTGMFKLISRGFRRWRLDVDGDVEKQIEVRGVADPKILPYYPYRDDAVPLFRIIKSYVARVVKYFYDTPEKLEGDYEVQNWVKEMATTQLDGGLGIGGMPEKLENIDQLITICTAVVAACSLGHAGANFQQYDAYGFVPNYPGILMNMPPQKKREMTEKDILEFLPNKSTTLDIMVITKLLSMKGTKSLGDFEVQYLYNPDIVHIAEEFRLELKKLSHEIKKRNKQREFKYEWFDPDIVPNSISI